MKRKSLVEGELEKNIGLHWRRRREKNISFCFTRGQQSAFGEADTGGEHDKRGTAKPQSKQKPCQSLSDSEIFRWKSLAPQKRNLPTVGTEESSSETSHSMND